MIKTETQNNRLKILKYIFDKNRFYIYDLRDEIFSSKKKYFFREVSSIIDEMVDYGVIFQDESKETKLNYFHKGVATEYPNLLYEFNREMNFEGFLIVMCILIDLDDTIIGYNSNSFRTKDIIQKSNYKNVQGNPRFDIKKVYKYLYEHKQFLLELNKNEKFVKLLNKFKNNIREYVNNKFLLKLTSKQWNMYFKEILNNQYGIIALLFLFKSFTHKFIKEIESIRSKDENEFYNLILSKFSEYFYNALLIVFNGYGAELWGLEYYKNSQELVFTHIFLKYEKTKFNIQTKFYK